MNLYKTLALLVDVVHLLVAMYLVGGFFVSAAFHPRFRKIHGIFGVVVFSTQLLFGFRCPLSMLSGYLMELAKPGYTDGRWCNPFIVKLLKNVFGFQTPETMIMITIVIGTGLAIFTLWKLRKRPIIKPKNAIS